MADFTVNLSGPQAAGANPVAPVSSRIDLSPVADIVDMFAKGLANKRKEEAEALKGQIISDYTQAKGSINDALAQGAIKPEEAAARTRALFNKYSVNNPLLTKEFQDIDKAFVASSAIGEVFEEEQAQQEAARQMEKDAVAAGFIMPREASTEFKTAQLRAFQAGRAADFQFKRITDRAKEEREIAGEVRASTQYQIKQESSQVLKMLASEHYTPASLLISDIANRRRNGEDPAKLQVEVTQYFGNINAAITQTVTLNPELGSSYRTLFGDLQKAAEQAASGQLDAQATDTLLKDTKNKLQLIALGDPNIQAIYAGSALLGGPLAISSVEQNKAVENLLKLSQENPEGLIDMSMVLRSAGDNKQLTDVMTDRISKLRTNAYRDPALAEEQVGRAVNNYTEGVGSVDLAKATPEQLASSASFFASPQFAEMVEKKKVSPDVATQARNTMQIVYDKTIIRGTEQILQRPFEFSGGSREPIRIADLLEVTFTGAGVSFDAKDVGYLSPVNKEVRHKYLRDVKAAKDSVNQLIHMGAHLEGHRDYAGYWERNKHVLMPSVFPDPNRLKVGQVVDGYEYVGGAPASKNSWRKVENANAVGTGME